MSGRGWWGHKAGTFRGPQVAELGVPDSISRKLADLARIPGPQFSTIHLGVVRVAAHREVRTRTKGLARILAPNWIGDDRDFPARGSQPNWSIVICGVTSSGSAGPIARTVRIAAQSVRHRDMCLARPRRRQAIEFLIVITSCSQRRQFLSGSRARGAARIMARKHANQSTTLALGGEVSTMGVSGGFATTELVFLF